MLDGITLCDAEQLGGVDGAYIRVGSCIRLRTAFAGVSARQPINQLCPHHRKAESLKHAAAQPPNRPGKGELKVLACELKQYELDRARRPGLAPIDNTTSHSAEGECATGLHTPKLHVGCTSLGPFGIRIPLCDVQSSENPSPLQQTGPFTLCLEPTYVRCRGRCLQMSLYVTYTKVTIILPSSRYHNRTRR